MRRKECPRSSNTAITFRKSSIPNLQQGACLAREVGEVGGETRGTARVGAGFAPNNTFRREAPFSSGQGVWGQHAPMSASFLSRNQTGASIHQPTVCKTHSEFIGCFGCGYAALSNLRFPSSPRLCGKSSVNQAECTGAGGWAAASWMVFSQPAASRRTAQRIRYFMADIMPAAGGFQNRIQSMIASFLASA
jgi:hypothetical protein